MGRRKSAPARRLRRAVIPWPDTPNENGSQSGEAQREARPVSSRTAYHPWNLLRPPTYKHASAKPDNVFKGQVAVLLEVPVPTDAQTIQIPAFRGNDCFPHAYNHAFGGRFKGPTCIGEVAVMVKDWDPGTEVFGSGLRHANSTRISEFLLHYDLAINDKLLTIAIVPRGGPCRRFDLDMQGQSLPAVVAKMVQVGVLRLYYVSERNSVQFLLPVNESGKNVSFMRTMLFRWLYNYKFAAGATVEKRDNFDREFVYGIARRRKTDADAHEYASFLDRVRRTVGLNVRLRPYQERAVAWMLSRELRRTDIPTRVKWEDARRLGQSCPVTFDSSVCIETDVYIDVMNGAIVVGNQLKQVCVGGGLLSDEMGLGKTVELMQLVLCNQLGQSSVGAGIGLDSAQLFAGTCTDCEEAVFEESRRICCSECGRQIHASCLGSTTSRKNSEQYICPPCRDNIERLVSPDTPISELPQSKATLVVIPTTLLLQWKTEIDKHATNRVVVEIYQGHSHRYLSLRKCLNADIVLTTYDALKNDVHTFNALRNPRRGLRHAKVHRPTPLPLLSVRWHRIAWDESQMLGASAVTQAAKLARYLHGTYRWCVTGTPLVHCLSEVLPMLDILGMKTGNEEQDRFVKWSYLLKPSRFLTDEQRLIAFLRQLVWRSTKEDVSADELQLPPQVTGVVHTGFGPVERYHYSSLEQNVKTATVRFKGVDNVRARMVSSDLLIMLRQACCHPQIGTSGRRLMSHAARQALGSSGNRGSTRYDAATQAVKRAESPLDMNEVLHALVAKAQAECAEALRSFVASSNGLAAVCWLQHSLLPVTSTDVDGLVTAVKLYRETLSLVEENKGVVQMDSIQRMHISFNLSEALDSVASTKKRLMDNQQSAPEGTEALLQLNSLGRTLRDSNLMQEVQELKRAYVAEAQAQLVACESSFQELANKLGREPLVPDRKSDEQSDGGSEWDSLDKDDPWEGIDDLAAIPLQWWDKAAASLLLKDQKKQEQFLNRVVRRLLDAIPGGGMQVRTLAHKLRSIHSFTTVLSPELAKLQRARKMLHEALAKMPGSVQPSQEQVIESGQCRECREFGTGPACAHCRAEPLFKDVERRLYALRESDQTAEFVLNAQSCGHEDDAPSTDHGHLDPKTLVNNALRPKGRPQTNMFAQNAGGLRFQSEVETILKALSSAAREIGDDRLNKEVSAWFERLAAMKKEHSEARALFEAQRSVLARMDEVNMALMRFSVLSPDEDVFSLSEDQQRHRLPRESLPSLNVQFTNEKTVAETDFANKRGNLVFLQSLQRCSDQSASSGASTLSGGPCAVCLAEFDDSVSKVALFVCGHVLCCDCTLLMIKGADAKSRVSSVRCPTCRTKCSVEEINFTRSGGTNEKTTGSQNDSQGSDTTPEMDNESDDEDDGDHAVGKRRKRTTEGHARKRRRVSEHRSSFYDAGAAVVGLVGAKASAIIRTLRGIWQKHTSAKVLIFSEWAEVLGLVSRALQMNQIVHSNGTVAGSAINFARMVTEFRTEDSINVLLLPLKKAGAGLNVTEATHVILIEPSMNVGLEEQAVGRVHRIGQEQDTFVHRIIMKGTIEEAVLRFGDEYRGKTGPSADRMVSLKDVLGAIHEAEEVEQECVVVTDTGDEGED